MRALSAVRGHCEEVAVCKPEREPSPGTKPIGTLILKLLKLQNYEKEISVI